MNLTNFKLDSTTHCVEILTDSLTWDLHNFARLAGFRYESNHRCFEIEWIADAVENPWGCSENQHKGCRLSFRMVRSIRISKDPADMKSEESCCLHGISKVEANLEKFRFKSDWRDNEPFNLLFEFVSGWEIEIDASSVELIGLV